MSCSLFPKVVVLVLTLVIQMNGFVLSSADELALLAIRSKITHDPQGVMRSWNDSLPFCRWEGVTCGRRHQRITSLDLPNMGLEGTLSPHIGNLSFLRYIILDNNQLHGSILPEIGRLLRLRVISLHNNSFTKEIPANITSCSKLSSFDLSNNMLSGKIPDIFSTDLWMMLKTLRLSRNNLTGGIPPSIGNLTSLEEVFLAYCPLGGSIPYSFSRLKNLQRLSLGENDLVGSFPSFFFNLSKLQLLNFPENQLVGSLPSNLCLGQPHLQRLELSFNHFSGNLPSSISNCSELQTLDASDNDFKGDIAIDFGKLGQLRWLSLGRNTNFGVMKYFDSLSNCSNLNVLQIEGVIFLEIDG